MDGSLQGNAADLFIEILQHAADIQLLLTSATYLQSSADRFAGMYALTFWGIACWQLRKFAEARERLQASLEKAKACGERWYETMIGKFIGYVAHDMGEDDQTRRYLTQALVNAREMGDPMVIIQALSFLGQITMASGETRKQR